MLGNTLIGLHFLGIITYLRFKNLLKDFIQICLFSWDFIMFSASFLFSVNYESLWQNLLNVSFFAIKLDLWGSSLKCIREIKINDKDYFSINLNYLL